MCGFANSRAARSVSHSVTSLSSWPSAALCSHVSSSDMLPSQCARYTTLPSTTFFPRNSRTRRTLEALSPPVPDPPTPAATAFSSANPSSSSSSPMFLRARFAPRLSLPPLLRAALLPTLRAAARFLVCCALWESKALIKRSISSSSRSSAPTRSSSNTTRHSGAGFSFASKKFDFSDGSHPKIVARTSIATPCAFGTVLRMRFFKCSLPDTSHSW
mmetsp:Transcript_8443/g.12354  ORF Transcript_8443/g.12354 Transcript_8443/m.12354 type:complete len:216 (+) Transcript_8443:106-753(+)